MFSFIDHLLVVVYWAKPAELSALSILNHTIHGGSWKKAKLYYNSSQPAPKTSFIHLIK